MGADNQTMGVYTTGDFHLANVALSTIKFDGTNTLNVSSGTLFFNGSAVGSGWTGKATTDLNMAGYNITSPSTLTVAAKNLTLQANGAAAPAAVVATGGTITYSGGYTYHTFTSDDTFTLTAPTSLEVEVLVVGGGGGGGHGYIGGGGGAGGVVVTVLTVSGSSSVVVGAGGAGGSSGNGTDGSSSSFFGVTAVGGGGGGAFNTAGASLYLDAANNLYISGTMTVSGTTYQFIFKYNPDYVPVGTYYVGGYNFKIGAYSVADSAGGLTAATPTHTSSTTSYIDAALTNH